MANWKEYTTKTIPEDADEIMIADSKANVSKRTPFSGLWNWIAGKLASAVIAQLETANKSIIPAINELNSKVPVISFANGSLLEYLEKYVQEEKDRIALIATRANVTDTYMFSCGLFLQAGEISTVIMVNYQNSEVSINSRSREGNWKAWKKL